MPRRLFSDAMKLALPVAACLLISAGATEPGGNCDALGGSCAGNVASTYLLQVSHQSAKTVPAMMDDETYEENYAHDSNNPLDSEYDAGREPGAPRLGANHPGAMVQSKKAEPTEAKNATAPASENATVSNASDANATVKVENATGSGASAVNSTSATDTTNSSDNATNETAPAAVSAPTCVTKKDERVKAWTMTTSPEGTPCIFGVDPRDEGEHCIHENGDFGSNGWCFTSKDGRYWGSCAEGCPLYGPHAAIGSKIDALASDLKKIAKVVVGDKTTGEDNEEKTTESESKSEVKEKEDEGKSKEEKQDKGKKDDKKDEGKKDEKKAKGETDDADKKSA